VPGRAVLEATVACVCQERVAQRASSCFLCFDAIPLTETRMNPGDGRSDSPLSRSLMTRCRTCMQQATAGRCVCGRAAARLLLPFPCKAIPDPWLLEPASGVMHGSGRETVGTRQSFAAHPCSAGASDPDHFRFLVRASSGPPIDLPATDSACMEDRRSEPVDARRSRGQLLTGNAPRRGVGTGFVAVQTGTCTISPASIDPRVVSRKLRPLPARSGTE